MIMTSERERLLRIIGLEPRKTSMSLDGVPWGVTVQYEIPFSKITPEGLTELIHHARESLLLTLNQMEKRLENFTTVAKVTMDIDLPTETEH